MPEIFFSYLVGFFSSFVVVIISILRLRKRWHSSERLQLQKNLQQVDLFWSESEGRVLPLTGYVREWDRKMIVRSALLSGIFICLLSWFGLVFFLLLKWSLKNMRDSKKAEKIFSSKLSQVDINSVEVRAELETVIMDKRQNP